MTDEDMQRTLCSEFPPLNVQWDGSEYTFVVSAAYEQLSTSIWFAQQDIDLSGYAMERKTFYPYSSFEQRGSGASATTVDPLTEQPYVADITIISSVPFNNNQLLAALTFIPGFIPGGGVGLNSNFNREVIIHGEKKIYTIDSTLAVQGGNNFLKLIDRQIFSSLEPTAADKLYSYRIIALAGAKGEITLVSVPASRVLLPGNISSEPKLEYMMRLKRSYELANQV